MFFISVERTYAARSDIYTAAPSLRASIKKTMLLSRQSSARFCVLKNVKRTYAKLSDFTLMFFIFVERTYAALIDFNFLYLKTQKEFIQHKVKFRARYFL